MNNPINVEIYILIARLFFSLLFIISGLNHLLNLERMAGFVRQKNVPAPKLVVILTGAAIIFGGISILLGLWVKAGAMILTIFLVVTAFFLHNFWEKEDPLEKANDMNHFLKDIALAGASLLIWYFGTGPLSLGN
ncbi:MAG: DoxX family protein [Cyclobacteriaceae bacterium]|nr:DoxX family protein [Cyclobacteriaceae bacterium]